MDAFLADLLVAVHLAIVTFMIAGVVLVLIGWPLRWRFVRSPYFRLPHLAIMAYIVVNAIQGEVCFLTVWENDLRLAAGQLDVEDISFIGRLLRDVLYLEVPQASLDRFYIVFGVLVAVTFIAVPIRFRRDARSSER